MAGQSATSASNLAILAAFAAALSTALGGSGFVAMRFLVTQTEPVTVAFLRNGIAAVLLGAIALATLRRLPAPRELLVMAAMGAVFFGLLQYIFATALTFTTSGRAAIVLTTAPFLTLMLAAAMRIEAPTGRKIAGIAVASAGVVLALRHSVGAAPDAWIGDLLVLGGALITAGFNVGSSRWLRTHEPLLAVTAGVVPGAALLLLIALASGAPILAPALSTTGWLAIAFLGLGSATASYMLWMWALRHTTPTLVAVTMPMNPIMALLWGAVLLGEPLTASLVGGLVLVIAGIVLTNWRSRRPALGAARPQAAGPAPR